MDNYHSYRGGARLSIYLINENYENLVLPKIKVILKLIFKYYGKKITSDVNELFSNFNFKKMVIY